MTDKNDSGSKTEKPTPKRLKNAREKGDVPKSKDLTGLILLFYWIVFFALFSSFLSAKFSNLLNETLNFHNFDLDYYLQVMAKESVDLFLLLSAALLLPATAIGLLVTFLQIGPVFTLDKIKPNMENINPAAGVKRMFSMDNLVELVKSVAKTAVLFCIAYLVFRSFSQDIFLLYFGSGGDYASAIGKTGFYLCLWTTMVFVFVSGLDSIYQKQSFIKKMRMSMRDIKQEHKDSEGDPMIKSERSRQHRELSEQGARTATSGANVLLVNPTHFAVAIKYDKQTTPIPKVIAKGHDDIAAAMREVARDEKIPTLRNIQLTRQLYSDVPENQVVPKELFDVIAEVIMWAQEVKQRIDSESSATDPTSSNVPGEDLTDYSVV